ncbi:ABC transporter ATP-binding protein [Micromonospora mangrovi]|uniref:ABC transporter ATP-binding protein n=2 Tax=Micromonospora TaxID=1873 RepID=A0AAU8HFR5_9ACTN
MTDILRVQTAVVSYGSVRILDGVDLRVTDGEALGVVGPNGAGKTTLLNVIAGAVATAQGRVFLAHEDVTRLDPAARCRRGIGRAFQIPRPFGVLTVLENVLVPAMHGAQLPTARAYERAVTVLERCGLLPLANRRADTLGLLHRKRLELARALAAGPRVLLLDEIAAGLTDAESEDLVDLILEVRAGGTSIVWIEHVMHVLLRVVDRLVCLDGGRVIADGEPRAVLDDDVVVGAYLGPQPGVHAKERTP